MARFAVILPAAGKSTRFRDREKKAFVNLDGRAVWLRSAELFINRKDVSQLVVVINAADRELFARRYTAHLALFNAAVVEGGAERSDSVANALARLDDDIEFVAVHDAARPCVTPEMIDAVFAEGAKSGAALLATPVADTLKRGDNKQRVRETVSRQGLWLAQTPQVFRRDWLADAYGRRAELGARITDDAQLVEAAGHPVVLVPGSSTNVKITTKEDLILAEAVLKARPKPKEGRSFHPFADEAQW